MIRSNGKGRPPLKTATLVWACFCALICVALLAASFQASRSCEIVRRSIELAEDPEVFKQSCERLNAMIRLARVLSAALLLVLFSAAAYILRCVVQPLKRLTVSIEAAGEIAPEGPEELRAVATAYNASFQRSRAVHKRLSYEASHDALTGLYNRNAYDRMLSQAREGSAALLIMDVDRFKTINDTYGHDMGDRVLRRVAGVLRQSFRSSDRVCRIGGDEFSVIMEGVGTPMTELVRRKLVQILEELSHGEDGEPLVTLSVGVAFSDTLEPGEDLFKSADTALYRVKQTRRPGYCFHHLPDPFAQP